MHTRALLSSDSVTPDCTFDFGALSVLLAVASDQRPHLITVRLERSVVSDMWLEIGSWFFSLPTKNLAQILNHQITKVSSKFLQDHKQISLKLILFSPVTLHRVIDIGVYLVKLIQIIHFWLVWSIQNLSKLDINFFGQLGFQLFQFSKLLLN